MVVYPITDAQVAETHPVGPYDIYGETKVMNEMQLGRWSRATGGTAVPVRLANVYGPRETNMHVVPEIMTQLGQGRRCLTLGDTRPYRDYIHTSDVARAMASLGVCDRLGRYEVFNLGTGTEHSVDDILSVLGDLLGEVISVCRDERHVRKIERMHLWPDTGKLRRVTGWAPRVELREGLRELCEIYGVPVRV
jgi:UDP-glucose 4-epimerase